MPLPYPKGSVYILENLIAQRVKIGTSSIGVNDVADRLKDINDMWFERKVTCQICGGRLINIMGLVPQHAKCGVKCPGGNALPIEKDVALAESHLEKLRSSLPTLSSTERSSVTRMSSTLEKRITKYRRYVQGLGKWDFKIAYYIEDAVNVETAAHKFLAKYLDIDAPFGEVFNCTSSEAKAAVEMVLTELGLFDKAKVTNHL